jgi:hypothetical protein
MKLGSHELVNSVHQYLNSTKPITLEIDVGTFISDPLFQSGTTWAIYLRSHFRRGCEVSVHSRPVHVHARSSEDL